MLFTGFVCSQLLRDTKEQAGDGGCRLLLEPQSLSWGQKGRGATFLPGELGADLLSELQPFLICLSGKDVLLF